ncbi:4-hydroxybenzoate octaprenyltransferase [Cyanobium sp. PCC 7001]|uniref:4-hydroxybenzoate polyprenyltransferase n=1 Tax=Cyanobium sp. PCC 7001 TaxID=180281 RepID=UPI00018057F4|nr:4-hydroxybenzoate polyprenyltransferase [Cyanobium sp. PCC 7001]EDY38708.1 4-hydroxybenzoate octaprenyltransferase [Cyanobium sp. PCC 7001]
MDDAARDRGAASRTARRLRAWLELVRWHKPSGRLILLIPAGWSLWLLPQGPPDTPLVLAVVIGGLAVSAAGCIANDLWDRRIDPQVERTRQRPLASGRVGVAEAVLLLLLALLLALAVVLWGLPAANRGLCLLLAVAALPPVLLYPSAKRWFPYPQLVLAVCWGFAVLIPWAAASGSLQGWPLALAWLATLLWTFGFDTVYAMADRDDDRRIGVRSSALSLEGRAPAVVTACYGGTGLCLALAALTLPSGAGALHPLGWALGAVGALGMVREGLALDRVPAGADGFLSRGFFGRHFSRQVWLGALLLLALVLGRLP